MWVLYFLCSAWTLFVTIFLHSRAASHSGLLNRRPDQNLPGQSSFIAGNKTAEKLPTKQPTVHHRRPQTLLRENAHDIQRYVGQDLRINTEQLVYRHLCRRLVRHDDDSISPEGFNRASGGKGKCLQLVVRREGLLLLQVGHGSIGRIDATKPHDRTRQPS